MERIIILADGAYFYGININQTQTFFQFFNKRTE